MGGIAALVTPPLAAFGCEIPAFAGMVFRGEWESGAYFGIVVCGGTEVCVWILATIAGDNLATIAGNQYDIVAAAKSPLSPQKNCRRPPTNCRHSAELPNCRRHSAELLLLNLCRHK